MASTETDVLIFDCEKFLKNIILNMDKSKNMSTKIKSDITKNVKELKSVVKSLKNIIKNQQNELLLQCQQNEKRFIDMNEKIINELKSIREQSQCQTRPLYTTIVRGGQHQVQDVDKTQHVILLKPTDKSTKSDETYRKVKELINPVKLKIGVKRVKNISDGGVLLECETEEECGKIAKVIETKAKTSYSCSKPIKRMPKIAIYNVPQELEEEFLVDTIISQNQPIKEFIDNIEADHIKEHLNVKLKLKSKPNASITYILEISPELRKVIMNQCNGLKIMWNICKFKDYVFIMRYFNCSSFGHHSNDCHLKDGAKTCGHCGQNHKLNECKANKNDLFCVNCDSYNKKSKTNTHKTNHSSLNPLCPSYQKMFNYIKSKVNYG
jgi:hypothetical protein